MIIRKRWKNLFFFCYRNSINGSELTEIERIPNEIKNATNDILGEFGVKKIFQIKLSILIFNRKFESKSWTQFKTKLQSKREKANVIRPAFGEAKTIPSKINSEITSNPQKTCLRQRGKDRREGEGTWSRLCGVPRGESQDHRRQKKGINFHSD